eukprot:COSAG04_NODE_2654_length_3783_cov_4.953312_3_plen_105_part_00
MDWRGGGKSAVLAELGKVLRASEMRKQGFAASMGRQATFEDEIAKERAAFEDKMARERSRFEASMVSKRAGFNTRQMEAVAELEADIKREMEGGSEPPSKRAKR